MRAGGRSSGMSTRSLVPAARVPPVAREKAAPFLPEKMNAALSSVVPWSSFLPVMPRVTVLLVPLLLSGCVNFRTEPIEVKPIHITVDVNVKVDKALDDFFGDLDRKSATRAY